MISPRRQLHKSKSDASTGSSADSGPMGSSNSPGRTGLFSYIAQARRRWTKSPWETDTLLPTTYSSTVTPYHSSNPKRPTPAALTCNHFLMGGHYYPGKDKKRRHLRRRTLWYKVFCSSPLRKAISVLLLLYVLIWHVIIPTVQLVWQGSINSRSPLSNWLLFDGTLQLPDLEMEQRAAIELAAIRARLQQATQQQRWQILENIVPVWYHRNDPSKTKTNHDPPPKHDKNEPPKKPNPVKETSQQQQQAKKGAVVVDTTKHQDTTKQTDGKVRILQKNGNGLVQRTLHTPHQEAIQYSQCPDAAHDKNAEIQITLVTQATMSRLWILNETCTRWTDPIVAVVFIPQGHELPSLSISCSNLQIIYYQGNTEESQGPNYPVNRLRNIGLDAVTTSHVFMMDVDFVPSLDLPNTIRQALTLQQQQEQQQQHHHHSPPDDNNEEESAAAIALVVPAFERLPPQPCETDSTCAAFLQSNSSFIPQSFEALQKCFQQKDCIVFQSNNNWEGHSTTRSELWLQRQWYQEDQETNADVAAGDAPSSPTLVHIPCFHTARYEPYVVLPWCRGGSPRAPYYDERFHGYGKNKIQLVSHLRKQGYRFDILPQGFIVHNPHPESSIKETWNDRQGSKLHAAMDQLYTTFLGELDHKYTGEIHERSVKLCKS